MEFFKKRLASMMVDGSPVSLTLADMSDIGENVHVARVGDLRLELTVTSPVDDAFTVMLRITNEGSTPSPRISGVRSFDVDFPASSARFEGLTGDESGADSFVPYTRDLTAEPYILEPEDGVSSNITAFPCFDVTADGTTYVFGVGWSGQWHAELDCKDGAFRLSVGLADCDFYLYPGESVRFPMTLCVKGETVLTARQKFRRVLREHFSPQAGQEEDVLLPIAIQPFDRYYSGMQFFSHS